MCNDLKIDKVNNPYNFKLSDLVTIAKRLNNPNRNFLFVSKILGKHIAVNPKRNQVIGHLLASQIYKNDFNIDKLVEFIKTENVDDIDNELIKSINTNEKCFIIGFAETATALGMAVAYSIKNSYYITTTREKLDDIKSCFNFKEEHSHATNHYCYLENMDKLKNADRIILVDDELTTGKTMINFIKEINKKYPQINKFNILTILDVRNEKYIKNINDFSMEKNINIAVDSIVKANIVNNNHEIMKYDDEDIINNKTDICYSSFFKKECHKKNGVFINYSLLSGRFGISFEDIRSIDIKAKELAKIINEDSKNKKVLILGHGEDIYIPSRIASFVKNCDFKTTTRSPIYVDNNSENYPIHQRSKFDYDNTTYYLYNKDLLEEKYDKIYLITEFNLNYEITNDITIIRL